MPISHTHQGQFSVQAERILRRLVMTSKAGKIGKYEKYVFEVAPTANKIEIKKAFTVLYGVLPLAVRTSILKPRTVRFGSRKGTRKKWKKAVITIDVNKSVTIV
ncbi:50S ribosomal protein L23 [Candidatus Uhrbacteria bacterium]|nr:50S ribosomal protein L23 [Candidatus Uhrbacteria bacterium]